MRRNTLRVCLGAAALGAILARCAPPPPLSTDPRVAVRADSDLIMDQPLIATTDATGFTHVTIPLHNAAPHDAAASCLAQWFDDAGHPMGGLSSMPQRVATGPYGTAYCETVSPSPKARSFSVQIIPTA